MSCRIIVADDHPLFREAMVRTVQRILPQACLEEAGNLGQVLELIDHGDTPDTLILDLRFPGLTCLERLAALRKQLRRTSLIIVSMVDEPELISQVMAAGADGFIGKSITPRSSARRSWPSVKVKSWSSTSLLACCPRWAQKAKSNSSPSASKTCCA